MRLVRICTLNGGEHSLLACLPAILAAGWEIVALLPANGPLWGSLENLDVQCMPIVFHDSAGRRTPQAEVRQELKRQLAELKPDLLHANSLAMGRLVGPIAKDAGLPSVAYLRDIVGLSRTAIDDLNANTLLVAVSHAARDFHVAVGVDPARTIVLHNGVDAELFRPRAATGYLHRELNIPAAAPLVAWIGQLGLRKDPRTYLLAAQQVAMTQLDVHFLVIGGRFSEKLESLALEAELRDLANSEQVAGRVHFLGVRGDLSDLLAEVSLVVHTARQEPLGRVLLEAAAAGKAIVATDVGGTREIFPPDCQAARIVPPGEADRVARDMVELLKDEAAREMLERNARDRACRAFTRERCAAELLAVYDRVVGESNSAGNRVGSAPRNEVK